jgi:predicted metal-dependent phosphoesterase TrpH
MSLSIIADLHTHSTASDGDCTPAEVVREACAIGLKAVALTDHDTLAGLGEALEVGRESGIIVICGVEVSLRFKRPVFTGSLHYLLYFKSALLENRDFVDTITGILSQGRGRRLTANRVQSINELFGPAGSIDRILKRPLALEEVEAGGANITRRHFAEALNRGHGLDREAVNRLISNDSPAYVPSGIEMHLLKPLFNRFPLVRVLAHPAAGSFPPPSLYAEVLPPWETVEKILPEFLALGLDGLEVNYPGHTAGHRELLRQAARSHGLLVTGGSDFHDRIKRPLGTGGVNAAELGLVMSRLGL